MKLDYRLNDDAEIVWFVDGALDTPTPPIITCLAGITGYSLGIVFFIFVGVALMLVGLAP